MNKYLLAILIPVLFLSTAFAQDSVAVTVAPTATTTIPAITTCKKISQTLWKGKYATGKNAQQWLIYDVGNLQKLLDKLGYFGPKPDYGENYDIGYYDDSTVDAVKSYQRDNLPWISATGAVGQNTLDFINKYELCNGDRRFAKLKLDKTFSTTGLLIKYPSADFRTSNSIASDDMLSQKYKSYLDVCSIDENADATMRNKSLCYKFNKDKQLSAAAFTISQLKGKTKDTCMQADSDAKPEDVNNSYWMAGLQFLEFKKLVADTGQQNRMTIFRIFKNNHCYEFKESIEVSDIGGIDDDDYLTNTIDQIQGKMRAMIESATYGN